MGFCALLQRMVSAAELFHSQGCEIELPKAEAAWICLFLFAVLRPLPGQRLREKLGE
jgi:hypothetical protein